MNSPHTKVLSTDKRSKNRLSFCSNKRRGKQASADVYRNWKRPRHNSNNGAMVETSAASREDRVHHEEEDHGNRPRQRARLIKDGKDEKQAVLFVAKEGDDDVSGIFGFDGESDNEDNVETTTAMTSNFASELDVALDRNGSEIFSRFHREIWHLCRSLPELLHHTDKIVNVLLDYLLSPAIASDDDNDDDSEALVPPATDCTTTTPGGSKNKKRGCFVVNYATTDILHLLAVLARDLRHEIHPFLHTKIMPRILYDLLSPPPPGKQQQPIPLDVTIVEAAFRALAYIFRYDAGPLLLEQVQEKEGKKKQEQGCCLEPMRQYYGVVLAHRRDVIRRLAAQAFAPLIRKLGIAGQKRHLKRVLRALSMVVTNTTANNANQQQQSSHRASSKRMQADAVDGIAQLLFQVARGGVKGRLHSKAGSVVVKCVLESVKNNHGGSDGGGVVYDVASAFFGHLCRFLERPHAVAILRAVLSATQAAISSESSSPQCALLLVCQMVSFQDGELIKEENNNVLVEQELANVLDKLMERKTFQSLSVASQVATVELLCAVWKAAPRQDEGFDNRMSNRVRDILQCSKGGGVASTVSLASMLAKDLLPHLVSGLGMRRVGSVIVSAAGAVAPQDAEAAILLIHAVVLSTRMVKAEKVEEHDDDSDVLFDLRNANDCVVTSSEKNALLDTCLVALDGLNFSETLCARLAISAQCASFVGLALVEDENETELPSAFKRVSAWLFKLMHAVCADEQYGKGGPLDRNLCVLYSIALECFARFLEAVLDRLGPVAVLKRSVAEGLNLAENHLVAMSESLWAVKSVAAFVEVIQKLGVKLKVDSNVVFESLTPNLRRPNHFLRLHSLEILASLPQRPFVVDHAELDLSGDLDEEPSSVPGTLEQRKGPTGMCDIISTLLRIESTPLSLAEERHILSNISRVEVLGRAGRLPASHAEAAASHLLGLLHVKFAPVWAGAVKALVALVAGHESSTWPSLHETIAEITDLKPVTRDVKEHSDSHYDKYQPAEFFHLCMSWETSKGSDSILFSHVNADRDEVRGSRYESADAGTVFESSWSVIEMAPQLMTQHSRSMVPIFLKFMATQYYAIQKDPDARELHLEEHVDVEDKSAVTGGEPVNRRDVQKRLIAILKVFAAINGPQQMVKHHVLQSIFVSLLSHPEAAVSQLAFRSLLKFKHQYILPYASTIEKLFLKGKLREALIQFKLLLETDSIVSEHRESMVSVMARIMFGRMSAKAIGKSSKDSPAARRITVLSFMSILCSNDDELYHFIYLMVRGYIPLQFSVKSMELQDASEKAEVLERLTGVCPDDLVHLDVSVHQGFLNMLESVVSSLGHRITEFVPAFVSIVVSLSKLYEVRDDANLEASNGEENVLDDEDENLESPANGNTINLHTRKGASVRASTVRALCYRRLVDIFSKFHSTVDFAPFSKHLWDSTKKSVTFLPEMVVTSENVPSLLSLLVTLSSNSNLAKFLDTNQAAVVSVLRCIDPRSGSASVDLALSFISNLLGETEGGTGTGPNIIRPHIDLLLEQFASRLDSSGADANKSRSKDSSSGHQTWKRELLILFRVSRLLDDQKQGTETTGNGGTTESLCRLLLPFLDSGRVRETEQLNVLGILSSLLPSTGASLAPYYYSRLSQLLGPDKAKPGIVSKQVRKAITDAIQSLVASCYTLAKPASDVLSKLSEFQSEHVDEILYDSVVPALSRLSDGDHWLELSRDSASSCEPSILLPLVHTCFFFLYEADGIIARSAFKAIKTLIPVASRESGFTAEQSGHRTSDAAEKWSKLLHGCIVPITRSCLGTRDVSIRRYFILILGEISRYCQSSQSPHLHGDLAQLIRDDDPDLDFFLNITHVQLHRRARALQRLRKALVVENDAEGSTVSFYPQSLSNVLLPLAVHPIYESKSNAEEALALEGIATAGAISRVLSWSKYTSILNTTLNQFQRHPEQERYIVGLLCAIIDGFHFDVISQNSRQESTDDQSTPNGSTAVMRALENRIIPKVESLLIKETKDRKGERSKTLRPSIVLALMKLFQKLPENAFHSKLPRLLTIICDILKSRESNARDAARSTLAKMVAAMDVSFLAVVVRELAVTLTEGYQLHVRGATVHSILLSLLSVYKPPEVTPASALVMPPFDQAVPGLMDLLQQDLFGSAQERKEADNQVRYVKEAGGSKSYHSLELISSMVLFRPSVVVEATKPASSVSAVHAIVSPFLERLRVADVGLSRIRRIRECLSRVASGLARNPSIRTDEVLKFVYATIHPFIAKQKEKNLLDPIDDDSGECDDEDLSSLKPILVSGNVSGGAQWQQGVGEKTQARVAEWRPSVLGAPSSAKSARQAKSRAEGDLARVYDGQSAPKLTGSNRFLSSASIGNNPTNGPASVTAVVFGLQLLHTALKKSCDEKNAETKAMLDPFVPLLTACVCFSSELEVVMLSLKCLGLFLRVDLPSFAKCTAPLASKTLDLLTSYGSSSNQNQQEITQASFKMLAFLMDYDRKKVGPDAVAEQCLPLSSDQMRVLLSFLRASVVDSDQHNPAITLVKSIMSRNYASSELYDLMETLLEQSVRSTKASLRQQSSSVFVNYLINYPLAPERVEQHMKQIVLNLKYEYAEGRLSAIGLLASVIGRVPVPVVETHCQLFFLPLTMQLVNDDSKECREAAANCISSLIRRLSAEPLQSLCDYVVKWSRTEGDVHRTAMQLLGILVESCPDFLRRNGLFEKLVDTTQETLEDNGSEWEVKYFALVFLEKAWTSFNGALVGRTDIWAAVVKSARSDHPWVRLVSSRVLTTHLVSIDLGELGDSSSKTFLVRRPGLLHEVARSFCHQLSLDDEQQSDEVVSLAVKSLSWILRAMDQHPKLCFPEGEADDSERVPVLWVITRLSNIARSKGSKRRQSVYKCFAAFATFSASIVQNHLELLLEPLHRSELEAYNELELPTLIHRQRVTATTDVSEECQLAKDVLNLLEERCDSQDAFLRAYAAVKTRAREKKDQRKLKTKTHALTDPQDAAQRRIHKQEREKKRRKRRVDERRQSRGGEAKRRHKD